MTLSECSFRHLIMPKLCGSVFLFVVLAEIASSFRVAKSYEKNASLAERITPTPVRALPSLNASHARQQDSATGAANSSAAMNASYGGEGVVYFLFLVTDRIPHANIWQMFFADAPRGSFRALVHCKNVQGCKDSGMLEQLPMLQQIPTTETWYCHDLVTAMVDLLKAAIALQAAPAGVTEKFVYVSDSTLPVKPFSEIHSTLISNDDSDFCMFPADQWGSARIDGHNVLLLKHHQWVVLNRAHADILAKDWLPVDSRGVWNVPLKGGSWAGKERDLSPQHFYHPPGTNWCTDEWAFFAQVFGAVEPEGGLRTFHGMSGPQLHMWGEGAGLMQGTCRTWTYWGWDNGMQDFNNVGSRISADFIGSKMSCYPRCAARPATLELLSDSSLTALRASPFLFARKFDAHLWMPNYYGIVLAH